MATKTSTVAMVNGAGVPMGLVIRGKPITDQWMLHRTDCQDMKAIRKALRPFPRAMAVAIEEFASLDEARADFNESMGEAGGFDEGGWDFDTDVTVKPCI